MQELEELRVTQALSADKEKEKGSKDSKKEEENYRIEPYHFADGN